jgi:hypothetical protein
VITDDRFEQKDEMSSLRESSRRSLLTHTHELTSISGVMMMMVVVVVVM